MNLITALYINDIPVAKYFICNLEGINSRDSFHNTALMIALKLRHMEIVALLIRAGANINASNIYGETALMILVTEPYDNKFFLNFFINYGADINAHDNNHSSVLRKAIEANNINMVNILEHYGAVY